MTTKIAVTEQIAGACVPVPAACATVLLSRSLGQSAPSVRIPDAVLFTGAGVLGGAPVRSGDENADHLQARVCTQLTRLRSGAHVGATRPSMTVDIRSVRPETSPG